MRICRLQTGSEETSSGLRWKKRGKKINGHTLWAEERSWRELKFSIMPNMFTLYGLLTCLSVQSSELVGVDFITCGFSYVT